MRNHFAAGIHALTTWVMLTTGCAPTYEEGADDYQPAIDDYQAAADDYQATDSEPKRLGSAFNGCSAQQKNITNNAVTDAGIMLSKAITHLATDNNRGNSQLYKKWFGRYDARRWDTVLSNVRALRRALSRTTITYYCRPTGKGEGYWGWSYGDPSEIYLGSDFLAPHASPGWRASTIIHELSHGLLKTKDSDDPEADARNDPQEAINGAYNYEEFCYSAR